MFSLETKNAPKNWNYLVQIFWARLASFDHLGLISDPLIVSKFHNETHDPKLQRRTTAATQSHSTVVVKSNMFLKRLSVGSKEYTKELKLECAIFLGQTS